MADIDLEMGAEGPRVRFNLFRKDVLQEKITRWIRGIARELGVVRETTRVAAIGIPPAESMEPSAMEQQIAIAHQLKADELQRAAQEETDGLGNELEDLGADMVETDLPALVTNMSSEIEKKVASLEAELPPYMKAMIDATADLTGFNLRNDTAHEPTTRSLAVWSATAFGTTLAEAFLNAPMFKNELGWMDGVSTAGMIGLGVAVIGLFGGIAAAQLKRPDRWRRICGALGVSAIIVVAAFYLLGAAHFRAALHAQADDVSAHIAQSFKTAPLRPLLDFAVLPYMFLNIGCMVLVAWKSIPMFGFGDLKARRARAEATIAEVQNRIDDAYDRCDELTAKALDEVKALVSRGEENASRAKVIEKTIARVAVNHQQQASRISDSKIACELIYRQTVECVHPAGANQARFRRPPEPMPPAPVTPGPGLGQIVTGLFARAAGFKRAAPELVVEINAASVEGIAKIRTTVLALEAAQRGGGAVSNILQFRR
ncbi:MAG TPA: hypothetical protein VFE18_15525 [Phenylobacterium sp.]|jgi:hypothetical protein|uniref:hypothetical protein n=1 Tax=Phenylobacterium sp. TaxID=1871053 RepID=UPI002D58CDCB|nr:hypothetical protein [Phenylobacterium sp.]HZZ69582.1 hypothetical protein [Phenylobacterium sp.]